MRIKGGQDFATGLLFIAVGLAALWIGADYTMGTAQRPGTGVLPRILSWCLIGTGGLLLIKSISSAGRPHHGMVMAAGLGGDARHDRLRFDDR